MYKLYQAVKILVDVPKHKVAAGDVGTIVDIAYRPTIAYTVDFVSENGPVGWVHVSPRDIIPARAEDVMRLKEKMDKFARTFD